jgi:hypothetical protein
MLACTGFRLLSLLRSTLRDQQLTYPVAIPMLMAGRLVVGVSLPGSDRPLLELALRLLSMAWPPAELVGGVAASEVESGGIASDARAA